MFLSSTAPLAPDLVAASDTGISDTDNLTSRDNSTAAQSLQFVVSGTVAGATVTVYANGVAIGSEVATDTSTTVTTDGVTEILDGAISITARQAEAGQPESGDSPPLSVTVDSVAPPAPAVPDLEYTSDLGISSSDNLTSDDQLIMRAPGAVPYSRWYSDGVLLSEAYSQGGWYWPRLPHGSHVLTVEAVDAAGNVSTLSDGLTVTIDFQRPIATAISLTPVSVAGGTAYDFTVTYSDDIGINVGTLSAGDIRVTGPGGFSSLPAFVSVSPTGHGTPRTATYRLTPPGGFWSTGDNGTYSVSSLLQTVYDTAGNPNNSVPRIGTFTVDVIGAVSPPELLDASDSGASATDNLTRLNNASPATALTFSVANTVAGSTVTLYADNVPVGSATGNGGTVTITTDGTTTLADGTRAFTARETIAGRPESLPTGTLSVVIDTTAPAAPSSLTLQTASDTGVSASDNLTNDNSPTFNAVAPGTGTLYLLVDGVLNNSLAVTAGGTFAITAGATTATRLADGTRQVSAWVGDAAGNESARTSAAPVTIDTVAPPAPPMPDLRAEDDSGASDSDNITNDMSLTIDVPGGAPYYRMYPIFAGPNELYRTGPFQVPTTYFGSNSYVTEAVDAAGNVSPQSPALTVTVDRTPPASIVPGMLDPSFASGGFQTFGSNISTRGAVLQPDGKVVVGLAIKQGTGSSTKYVFGAARFHTDGWLDPTFGVNGIATGPADNSNAGLVALQPDGKIIVGGSSKMARFTSAGALDTTFGNAGIADGLSNTSALTTAPDGSILAAAVIGVDGLHVARYLPDGTPDLSFGGAGTGRLTFAANGRVSFASDVEVMPDGKIVATAAVWKSGGGNGRDPLVVRFSADGTPDTNFGGGDGFVELVNEDDVPTTSLIRDRDGRLLIVGTGTLSSGVLGNGLITRLNDDGTPDSSFGNAGVLRAPGLGFSSAFIDDAGRIVAAGSSPNVGLGTDFNAARYLPDGTIDATYGTGGVVRLGFGTNKTDTLRAVLPAAGGKHVLVGVSYNYNETASNGGISIARYLGEPRPAPNLQDASDDGPSHTDNVTSQTDLTFDVPEVVSELVHVYRNGELVRAFAPAASFTLTSQPLGTWDYAVVPVDAAGNAANASASIRVTIAAPSLPAWVTGAASWDADTKSLTITGIATITANPADFPESDHLSIIVNAGGALEIHPAFASIVTVGSLVIASGGSATFIAAPSVDASWVLVVEGTFDVDGTLDVTNNAMLLRNSSVTAIASLIASGYAGSAWNGVGINSSSAATDETSATALGFASNADLFLTEFQGVTDLDGDDVFIRFTTLGDSDLNGETNLDDFPLFTAGLENPSLSQSWVYGDYDFNGDVNLDDFPLFVAGLERSVMQ